MECLGGSTDGCSCPRIVRGIPFLSVHILAHTELDCDWHGRLVSR